MQLMKKIIFDFISNLTFSKLKYPLILLILYSLFFLWINPLKQSNFIVGDEWSSFRQIEAFQNGIFRLNGAKDTSFILQGVLAYALTFIISDNFFAVRVLNFFVSLVFLMGVFYLSEMLLRDEKKSFFAHPACGFQSFSLFSKLHILFRNLSSNFTCLGVLFFWKILRDGK